MRYSQYTSYISWILLGLAMGAISFPGNVSAQERTLSAHEMFEDIHLLRIKLEEYHPNLYLKKDTKTMDYFFDLLEDQTTAQTESEFYASVSSIGSLIMDGHLTFLPSAKLLKSNSSVIPLHILYIGDVLQIDKQYSSHPSIPRGSRIIFINERAGGAIASDLLRSLPADANNWQYPSWILNRYFASYYSFAYGHPHEFVVGSYYEGKGRLDTLQAMSWDSIEQFKATYPAQVAKKGIEFQIDQEENYATLIIRDFHPAILRKQYHQDFNKEIHTAFLQLQNKNISNLILDLRDNQGGKLEYGRLLLSHLMKAPFTMIEAYYKRVGQQAGAVQKTSGPCMGIAQPNPLQFKGQLYVLINGGTFSNSSIVASCLRRNTNAIFLGEETGGNRQVIGGFTKTIVLPNSKIMVEIPTRRIVLDSSLPFVNEGIKPDQEIKPTFEDLVNHIDPVMENAIKRIQKKN